MVLLAVLSLNIAMWLYLLQGNKSYLLLNQAARTEKERHLKKMSRLKGGMIFTLVIGAITGVLGNKLTSGIDSLW